MNYKLMNRVMGLSNQDRYTPLYYRANHAQKF